MANDAIRAAVEASGADLVMISNTPSGPFQTMVPAFSMMAESRYGLCVAMKNWLVLSRAIRSPRYLV